LFLLDRLLATVTPLRVNSYRLEHILELIVLLRMSLEIPN
jgi:hypothetical protein